jgi:chromate transport protein ChrA
VAAALFLATATLVVRGGEVVGPHLSLLSNYLPGYSVSWGGAVIGVLYGLVLGFLAGFVFAVLRNVAVALYLRFVWTRFQHHVANDLLDRMS